MKSKRNFDLDRRRKLERGNESTAFRCLIVAADQRRCEVLCQAAETAGWIPIASDDVPSAVVNYERTRLPLVVVDLHIPRGHGPSNFRNLLEWFAAKQQPLIVICGHEGDVQEEIWARQLGPWLYLTGEISPRELAVHLSVARQQTLFAGLPD